MAEPTRPTYDLDGIGDERIDLRLYIAGTSHNSARAVERVWQICADSLAGHYHLEIIDLYQAPYLAQRDQVLALPTLIKVSPLPVCRVVGDMSDKARVLAGLGIPAAVL